MTSMTALREVPAKLPLGMTKIMLSLMLTYIGCKSWMIPLMNKEFSTNEFLLGVTNSFSGGVFFMLAFGHLLPEALEGYAKLSISAETTFLVVLGGYFLMFVLDKILFDPRTHAVAITSEGGKTGQGKGKGKGVATGKKPWDGSALALVGAMSIHSAFETMALGLSRDKKSALLMFASIGIHQPAESIALLVALLKTEMTRGQIAHLLLAYSSVSIIAILAATFLSRFATPSVDATVMALTTGTFIYVGATEVVNEEFENVSGDEMWYKFAALIGGMSTIYAITQFTKKIDARL